MTAVDILVFISFVTAQLILIPTMILLLAKWRKLAGHKTTPDALSEVQRASSPAK